MPRPCSMCGLDRNLNGVCPHCDSACRRLSGLCRCSNAVGYFGVGPNHDDGGKRV